MTVLSVSASSVDITPVRSLPLAGYMERRVSAAVADRLMVAALVFQDSSGQRGVLISADLLYIGAPLVNRICAFLHTRYAIDSSAVVFAASHTHFAPATDPTKPCLGGVDADYLEEVGCKIEAMLTEAMEGAFVSPSVRTAHGEWGRTVYRRLPWYLPRFYLRKLVLGEPVMAPNPAINVDKNLRVWQVTGPDGACVAIVWNFACHPTEFSPNTHISSDFVGVVRERFVKLVGKDVPVLFLQGFSGDIRPMSGRRSVKLKDIPRFLLIGPGFAAFNRAQWGAWSDDLAEKAGEILTQAQGQQALCPTGELRGIKTEVPLDSVVEGAGEPSRSVTFQRLCVGGVFDIFSVSAEVSNCLEDMVPVPGAVMVGAAGDCFGYWPSSRQRNEGGYEGGRYFPAFNLNGKLSSRLDEYFSKAISKLL